MTSSFVLRMPDGRFFRAQLEMLTATEGRWLLTDGDAITHPGPGAIADEPRESVERRILAWWHARLEAGHWSRGRGP